jgi:AcrR family transcriptional regulator
VSSGCTVRYTEVVEPSNNRAHILKVALDLFSTRGYDASGVKEIVETVGVTKPTLYHYFGNKQGLLRALLDEHTDGFLSDLRVAAAYSGNLRMTLERVVAVYLDFAESRPSVYRLMLALLVSLPENESYEAGARLFDEQRQLLERMFEDAVRDHGNMRGRQRRYAYSFLGVLNGYAALVLGGQLVADDRLRRDVVHQFSHGIYS